MEMGLETRWEAFPHGIRKFLKNLKATAVSKSAGDIYCGNPDAWRQVTLAVDNVEFEGYPRVYELFKSLEACWAHKWIWKLSQMLSAWERDPGMPVDVPSQVAKTSRRRKPKLPEFHSAPGDPSSASHVWNEFRHSDLYWNAKSMAIVYDPATADLFKAVRAMGRHEVHAVSYMGTGKLFTCDGKILMLDEIPSKWFPAADVFISGCETFNRSRQVFTDIESVHVVFGKLRDKGFIGNTTKLLGVGYLCNGQYNADYFDKRKLLFKADSLLTEVGDEVDGNCKAISDESKRSTPDDDSGVALF